MRVVISNRSGVPLYEQIVEQLTAAILAGEVAEGEALPSVRALARDPAARYQSMAQLEYDLVKTLWGRTRAVADLLGLHQQRTESAPNALDGDGEPSAPTLPQEESLGDAVLERLDARRLGTPAWNPAARTPPAPMPLQQTPSQPAQPVGAQYGAPQQQQQAPPYAQAPLQGQQGGPPQQQQYWQQPPQPQQPPQAAQWQPAPYAQGGY